MAPDDCETIGTFMSDDFRMIPDDSGRSEHLCRHPLNPVVPHGVRQALLATLCHTGCCSPSVHDFCQSFLLRLAATPSRLCQMAMRFVPRSAQRRSRRLFACRSRCLFVCEFDPTDRSSLVSPIRQQTIANAPHACMPKPFLGLLLILINYIKIPWA